MRPLQCVSNAPSLSARFRWAQVIAYSAFRTHLVYATCAWSFRVSPKSGEDNLMSDNRKMFLRHATPVALTLILPAMAQACARGGCSLSTDAAMGYSASPGWRIDLEYDYIPQNQLRNGTGAVSNLQPAAINDAGGSQEVERQTINRYLNLGISYSPSVNWNFSALIPYIDRSHTTNGNATPHHPPP